MFDGHSAPVRLRARSGPRPPKYPDLLQLAAILRAAIEHGDLARDRPLPSYATLMQEHDVARGTAAKAVQVLVGEGLVKIVPGRGAYVTRLDERPQAT